MELQLTTMPFIVLAVYFIIWILKKFIFKSDESRKNLPPIAAAIGCAIAIAFYFLDPDEVGFSGIIDCCTTGMASGLAAVGCNQVYKQFQKFKMISDDSES